LYLPAGVDRRAAVLTSSFLALLFPDDCRLCGEPLLETSRIPVCSSCLSLPEPLEAEYFCSSCRTSFLNHFPLDDNGRCALCRSGSQAFDAAYSYGAYEGPLRGLIHILKYERVRTLAKPLAERLTTAYPLEQRFDAVVAMPLHWFRYWQRGFNQAALLAKELARRRGIPVVRAVRRVRATEAQAGMTRARRRANVAGAFKALPGRRLEGMRVLLVDDVFTTGATANACARALKQAGAAYVAVLTLARADRRLGNSVFPGAAAAAGEAMLP
jgi:ComF family protein